MSQKISGQPAMAHEIGWAEKDPTDLSLKSEKKEDASWPPRHSDLSGHQIRHLEDAAPEFRHNHNLNLQGEANI